MVELVVDDFGVEHVDKEHVKHLTDLQYYEITEDWTGNKFLGIYVYWNYSK